MYPKFWIKVVISLDGDGGGNYNHWNIISEKIALNLANNFFPTNFLFHIFIRIVILLRFHFFFFRRSKYGEDFYTENSSSLKYLRWPYISIFRTVGKYWKNEPKRLKLSFNQTQKNQVLKLSKKKKKRHPKSLNLLVIFSLKRSMLQKELH